MLVEPLPHAGAIATGGQGKAQDDGDSLRRVGILRHALAGDSVIDQTRSLLRDRDAIDAFLRVHQFDTDSPLDLARLKALHGDAAEYLTNIHGYQLPPSVEDPKDIHDLFLQAASGPAEVRRFACMALKVMHTIHHLRSREMVFNLAISEADLLSRLNTKVFGAIDEMRATGISVEEFATGKKTPTSMITKLLAKKGTLATHIFDKLRFRIVLQTRDDLVKALLYLLENLVPFDYVVPEQSQNGLVTLEDVARVLNMPPAKAASAAGDPAFSLAPSRSTPRNEFSGSTYRCVNFVADIPLRLDDVAPEQAPAIGVVQAEIQLVDAPAARENEQGENAHALYKKRQRETVRRRLESA